MNQKIRWGIISTGNIANQMARALNILDDAEITCVLSRNESTAKAFAKTYNIPNYFWNRNDFANFKDVDIVYVASLHPQHLNDTLLSLNSGKHVLCEKPMALNANEVIQMINAARTNKRFLMEALWSAFFPAYQKAISLIRDGEIGEIQHIAASFAFKGSGDVNGRHLDPEKGGGSLLDLGVYPLYFATLMSALFPVEAISKAYIGPTGVDEHSSYMLKYKNGATANLNSGFTYQSNDEGIIYGKEGYIKLKKFWQSDQFTLYKNGKKKKFKFKRLGNGYTYEALHIMELIKNGQTESPVITHEHSLKMAQLMDSFRESWNFVYPQEER